MCALFWRQSARDIAKRVYYGENNPNARPDLERFGFDPSLEFNSTPSVERSVKDPESPTFIVQQGVEVKRHASGLTYPVNIAFATGSPPIDDESPLYYVAELHGAVKWVDRLGRSHALSSELLNFEPTPMKISDELGVSGLCAIPDTKDLLVTHAFRDEQTGQFYNAVTRLNSDDGRSCSHQERILELKGEPTAPSNQIQQIRVGPDGKLYVSVGDAMNYRLSRDLNCWGGKILRLNLDGSSCEDNPYYNDQNKSAPISYVYASGLRNCFDFVFDSTSSLIWAGDVGPDINRIVAIRKGDDLGWDGTRESFCRNAAYLSEGNRLVFVGMCHIDDRVMGDSRKGQLWVGSYSNHNGPGPLGVKRIVSFTIADGRIVDGPKGILAYVGTGQSTVCGMAHGPDGIYFADFFGEQSNGDASGHGRVMRISPSARTAELPVDRTPVAWPSWDSVTRGMYIFTHHGSCASCHTVDRVSAGREGPVLNDLVTNLTRRLHSKEYLSELDSLLQDADEQVRSELLAVKATRDEERLRTWIRSHIRNPMFDNPKAKMPGSTFLTNQELSHLVDFLMTLD